MVLAPLYSWTGMKSAIIIFLTILIVTLTLFDNDVIFRGTAIARTVVPSTSTGGTPNIANPKTGTTSVIHLPPPVKAKPFTPAKTPQLINRIYRPSMKPMILGLDPVKGAHAISSDNSLEVTIPAGAITNADLATVAPAKNGVPSTLSLRVTQIAPGSGSNTGGGVVSFGTYKLEVIDGTGNVVAHGLRQPAHLQFHLGTRPTIYDLSKAFVTINGAMPGGTHTTGGTTQLPVSFDRKSNILATDIPADASLQPVTPGTGAQTFVPMTQAMPLAQVFPETVISFNTYAPVAVFGGPSSLETNMNVGASTQGIKIDVPPGPAGTLPDLTLAYNSSVVNDQHSAQTTATWVGEGWNMSLGSISWSERNVHSDSTSPDWRNTWTMTDPFGTTSEIIPPNATFSNYYDDTVFPITAGPTLWHAANENYAKIESFQSSFALPYGANPPSITNPQCFRVFLKNGVMMEFGCTADSIQYYVVPSGGIYQGQSINGGIYFPVNWMVDLITDQNGNQVHITYQADTETGANNLPYTRDLQLSTISWDDPTCVNASTMCSPWNPHSRVVFNASHAPTRLTNTPSGCNTGVNTRCDDPTDQGILAPLVMGTLVLNDIQVQNLVGSTWTNLRDYQLGYEESGPTTITDPVTGQTESTSGMFDLTRIQEFGSDGTTAYPPTTFGYTTQTEYYEDSTFFPYSQSFCGPSWNTGGNGGTCDLWSQSYAGNSRYLSSIDNGQGLNQQITWENARNNTHGSASPSDPFYCNTHQSGYPCNSADDQAWSRIVVQSRTNTVQQITQNGQGGAQTTTPITSTYVYNYVQTYPLAAQECGDCVAGMYWGNQNDGDFLDYYNGKFMGFAQASVSNPDGSVEVDKYYSTMGWGVYDTSPSQGITCPSSNLPPIVTTCQLSPWWNIANVGHGRAYDVTYYDTNGTTLLKHTTATFQAVCPPSGVAGSPAITGFGNFDNMLISELDYDNPVAVCDVQQTQATTTMTNGTGSSVTATTNYTYDALGRVTQTSTASNGGTPTTVVNLTSYIWNDSVTATSTGASGFYLLTSKAFTATQDGNGNRVNCQYFGYDGMANATGLNSGLTRGNMTTSNSYSNCGTSGNNYTPSGLLSTGLGYDTTTSNGGKNTGNMVGMTTPNANAGFTSKNCSTLGVSYTNCLSFDNTVTDSLVTGSSSQTLNTSANYSGTVGNGLQPATTTDPNSNQTAYTYDSLGRALTTTLPGNTSGTPNTSMVYANWCIATGAQAPCVEEDTITLPDHTAPTNTVTTRKFYDGNGHLVETRTPAPNGQDVVQYTLYDVLGRAIKESRPYYVTAYTGAAGSAAFSLPDTSQAVTVTTYDGLGRTRTVTDPLSHVTTTQYSVACNPVSGDTGCYEQKIIIDANSHQTDTLTDALGRDDYDRKYTGNSSYALYATTSTIYDAAGHAILVTGPTGKVTLTLYDNAGRLVSKSDPDLGDFAYTNDPNGNQIETQDSRSIGRNLIQSPGFEQGTTGWTLAGATLANNNANSGNNLLALSASGNTASQTVTIPTTGTYSLCLFEASNVAGSTLTLNVNGIQRANMALPSGTTYSQQCLPNQVLNANDSAQVVVTSSGNWLNIDDVRLALVPATPTGTMFYCYDNLNRKTAMSATSNTCASPLATWSYDAGTNGKGQLTGESFSSNGVSGSYAYGYDGNGNQTNWSMTIGGTTYPFTTTYNDAKQPTKLTYPDGDTAATSYTSQDWLSGMSETLNSTTNTLLSVNYQNAAGAAQMPSSALVGNGIYQWNLNYDALFNPIEQQVQKVSGSVTLFDQTRSYDAVGNVSTVNTTLPTGTDHQMFCYDAMNRMTWAGSTGTAPCGTLTAGTLTAANYQQSYTFDTLNRLTTGPSGSQTYGDPNHLDAVTSVPGYTASYDPAGNMTTRSGQPLSYDALSRQTNWQNTATNPTQTATYAYNGEGERVQQVVTNSGTTTTTNYIGTNEEVSTTGSTTTTTKYYSIGVALVANVNGTLSYLVKDFLGSISMALDNAGNVTATTLYAPYGTTRYSTGMMPTTRSYTSMVSDPSGLFYDHARYYDGGVGQFTTADTMQGPNRYGYVAGNPETYTDPTGHLTFAGSHIFWVRWWPFDWDGWININLNHNDVLWLWNWAWASPGLAIGLICSAFTAGAGLLLCSILGVIVGLVGYFIGSYIWSTYHSGFTAGITIEIRAYHSLTFHWIYYWTWWAGWQFSSWWQWDQHLALYHWPYYGP
jgi:RHS repeat-associated protein